MNYLSTLKTVITSLILIVITNAAFAQSAQTEVEIIQEAFGLDKKVAVANFMELGEDAESFWKIYDEYEAERKELGMNRISDSRFVNIKMLSFEQGEIDWLAFCHETINSVH